MGNIKEILHTKRTVTEEHIKQLQREGKEGIRYTAMMPDIPFLVLGLICDIGWLIHLAAGILYFCSSGFRDPLDWAAITALASVMAGVAYTIYMNKIHEKEIATKFQKNMSFRLTVFAGLTGGVIGVVQIAAYTSVPKALVWMAAGGLLNFVAGLPIYLSFREGIVYGVR
ncbi:MAG: hypothetical protein NC548_56340 [Lachnospiraceae bacterium]|nr:hypothetical protein [Lachnospiraceae bacterium]